MTSKLSTTLNNIETNVLNIESKRLILRFPEYMKRTGTSEKSDPPRWTVYDKLQVL
ncbi:MAG TPA: hypothetical protein VLD84_04380 [Nitrososphaeraceae archaeon]|nr:hypothetical protein [Nitrososphaeraceae archaeon]